MARTLARADPVDTVRFLRELRLRRSRQFDRALAQARSEGEEAEEAQAACVFALDLLHFAIDQQELGLRAEGRESAAGALEAAGVRRCELLDALDWRRELSAVIAGRLGALRALCDAAAGAAPGAAAGGGAAPEAAALALGELSPILAALQEQLLAAGGGRAAAAPLPELDALGALGLLWRATPGEAESSPATRGAGGTSAAAPWEGQRSLGGQQRWLLPAHGKGQEQVFLRRRVEDLADLNDRLRSELSEVEGSPPPEVALVEQRSAVTPPPAPPPAAEPLEAEQELLELSADLGGLELQLASASEELRMHKEDVAASRRRAAFGAVAEASHVASLGGGATASNVAWSRRVQEEADLVRTLQLDLAEAYEALAALGDPAPLEAEVAALRRRCAEAEALNHTASGAAGGAGSVAEAEAGCRDSHSPAWPHSSFGAAPQPSGSFLAASPGRLARGAQAPPLHQPLWVSEQELSLRLARQRRELADLREQVQREDAGTAGEASSTGRAPGAPPAFTAVPTAAPAYQIRRT